MAKKKNQKKAESHAKKSAVETLRFQTHWGLKQLGQQDGNLFHELVDAEVNFIAELDLAQDLLAIKSLVDGVKQSFAVVPTAEKGDFTKSPTAVALLVLHISMKSTTLVFLFLGVRWLRRRCLLSIILKNIETK